ncbi:DUF6048 family protein [Abyssalbus ytuae]|uniref:DUF6048 family protein n=1 Tax=Abyssalbus ytuae TaxID=2926907 RepID=A0A9E7D2Y1_9FLAO|nr:DUF6048 family protein [Abyssalbus ytuae]UOB17199.1 DUF6048 family protein [Abyssalbus ytuae]
MLKYITSTIFTLAFTIVFAQTDSIRTKAKDTAVVYKQKYGLRIGADASKIVRSLFNDNYKGFEIVGDFRISRNLYLAAEIGTEEKFIEEDLYSFTSTGNYIKAGVDINTYENWYGMENIIFIGLRVGTSSFKQDLHEYRIYNSNQFWGEGNELGTNEDILGEKSGLSAIWSEVVLGIKAELLNNLYIGGSIRLHYLISDKAANNFPNLYIPGFNKVTDGSKFGVGYNYTITYLIPIFKKTKKKKKDKNMDEE